MRVTLFASMPTAKPQQLDKPQFDELPVSIIGDAI
jgi:hypothetical protein